MTLRGSCDCGNIEITWHVAASGLVPRACQCEYCVSKSAAYVTESGSKVDLLIANQKLHKIVQHGSNTAKFHECKACNQVVFVTAEIDGKIYGALNSNLLDNRIDFSEPVLANFSSQTADEKRDRWRRNWCYPVHITMEGK